MILSEKQLKELSEYAISAATQAGKIIAEYRNGKGSDHIPDKKLEITKKEGKASAAAEALTEVDLICDKLIRSVLEPTLDAYKLALLSEEEDDDRSRLEKDHFWCIDPIDGTLPFIENAPGYSVSIALISQTGVPQIGVVYDPVQSSLYHATRGQGAFKNGLPWNATRNLKAKSDTPLSFYYDRSFTQDDIYYKKCFEAMHSLASKLSYSGLNPVQQGGGVMNAIQCIEQAPACYFKFPNKQKDCGGSFWDFAASAAIFNELKLPVSNIHGQPLDLNRPECVYMSHQGVLYASDQNLADEIRQLYIQLSEQDF